ncbi:hypothetical protein PPYR_15771 [Photinus pyralis]|uniref:DDE Tnp4 domain-containing protein n=2 Tax=Photinus pyralis TaxID=7054 RepID=A0A5N4A078_PHOPY|nr:hypothetical protein PPYR_15771 [Photinus pyralis]
MDIIHDDDDLEIIDFIINGGLPRQIYIRNDHFHGYDNESFRKRFRISKVCAIEILQQIEMYLEFPTDSGYPNRRYLMTPLLNPATPAQQLYNEAHIRTRNCIERCFGVIKRRFPILAYGCRLLINSTLSIIMATSVLHNKALQVGDLNVPNLPDEVNIHELDVQIQNGNIPVPNMDGIGIVGFRHELINNYFANL